MAKRKVVKVDKKTAERMHAEAKEAKMDEANELPIPQGDGIDHARWPAEARKLALLLVNPETDAMTQDELAKACGYSLRSVQRYMVDSEFKAYLNALMDRVYDDEVMLEAKKTLLYQMRKNRNLKAVEIVYKSRGMLKEVRQVTSDVTVKDERVSDDLDADIERLEKDVGVRRVVN
jgi:hypothetical protein